MTANETKVENYKPVEILVLVVFDEVDEIYNALNHLANQNGKLPDELFLINIVKNKVKEFNGYFTRASDDFSKERAYTAKKGYMQKEGLKFPKFNKERISTISLEELKKDRLIVNRKIESIYENENKRETVIKNLNLKIGVGIGVGGDTEQLDLLEKKCIERSPFFKRFEIQDTHHNATPPSKSYRLDFVQNESNIHVCISHSKFGTHNNNSIDDFHSILYGIGLFMGGSSRRHDLASVIGSKKTGKDQASNDEVSFNYFHNTKDTLSAKKSKAKRRSKPRLENNLTLTPELKFYTTPSKDDGSESRPEYLAIFNEKEVLLSLKNATYLYSWLSLEKGVFIKENDELGFIKAQCYCKLRGASDDEVQNKVKIIKFIGKNFPTLMTVIIGDAWKNLSKFSKKRALQKSNKSSVKNKNAKEDIYPNISKLRIAELKFFLKEENIGGYLGGKTEDKDKTQFKKSVELQLGKGAEWLIPKNVRGKLTSEAEFSQSKGDKNDLVNFLIENNMSWDTYQNIVNKYPDISQVETTGSGSKKSIPPKKKKFIRVLTDFKVIN